MNIELNAIYTTAGIARTILNVKRDKDFWRYSLERIKIVQEQPRLFSLRSQNRKNRTLKKKIVEPLIYIVLLICGLWLLLANTYTLMEVIVPSYTTVLTTIIRNQVTKLLVRRVRVIDHYNYRHNAYSHVWSYA